jgi:hypothetical protein
MAESSTTTRETAEATDSDDRLTRDALDYLVGMDWQRQPDTFARSLAIRQFLEEHVEVIRERANAILATSRNALRPMIGDRPPPARDDG